MTKTLLVMRHAKSSWAKAQQLDHDRRLSRRGKREAELLGRELVRRGLVPNVALVSTAQRARSTAKRVLGQPGMLADRVDDGRLYDSSPRQCLRALAEHGVGDTVLLIGHNPTFEELVRQLTARYVALGTAAVAVIELPIRDWSDVDQDSHGRLLALFSPRDVAIELALPAHSGGDATDEDEGDED